MKHNIFVINMKNSVDRRTKMTAMLDRLGASYEIFDAVNGKELSEADKALCLDADYVDLRCRVGGVRVKDALTLAEKGCALSHLRLYQKIIDLGLSYAVVMEDDIEINENTMQALDNVSCIKESWDIINFSVHYGFKSWPFSRKYFFDDERQFYFVREGLHSEILDAIFNRRRYLAGTFLYVISASACKRLIDIGYPVRLTSDMLYGHLAFNRLKIFRVFPVDKFVKLADTDSDIGDRPVHTMERIK